MASKPFSLSCLVMALLVQASVAQQPVPEGYKQYKRVHQEVLKKVVDGNIDAAITDLNRVLEQIPGDAESLYMLAVAHATRGNAEEAEAAMHAALGAGLPADRFLAGTKTGLESIRDRRPMRELLAGAQHKPAHGPMLGQISGTQVSVWLRTAKAQSVSAVAWEVGKPEDPIGSDTVTSGEATDFTAVIRIDGLKPNTNYEYAVLIDNKHYRDASYRFHTLSEKGSPVRFRLAFGGGAGFVPQHEHMWSTIRGERPDVLMLLGDNVYSDAPKMPEMQHYCYYRRQSRPEYRQLTASTPVFAIWDDHDFGTNDCSGGPAIDAPFWKQPVYGVFRNNWVNPYYGGGIDQPGCYYDYYLGDVHFIMLDGRYYRNLKPEDDGRPTMLGPVQRKWLLETLKASEGKLIVLCSPVPWVYRAKGDSKDTWNGFKEERSEIFDMLTTNGIEGVVLMSADRHRSDLWKIQRADDYSLFEFNSSRLTNQHVHPEMAAAIFSYNKKQSFGTVDIDTTVADPTLTYRVVSIDGEEVHRYTVRRTMLAKP